MIIKPEKEYPIKRHTKVKGVAERETKGGQLRYDVKYRLPGKTKTEKKTFENLLEAEKFRKKTLDELNKYKKSHKQSRFNAQWIKIEGCEGLRKRTRKDGTAMYSIRFNYKGRTVSCGNLPSVAIAKHAMKAMLNKLKKSGKPLNEKELEKIKETKLKPIIKWKTICTGVRGRQREDGSWNYEFRIGTTHQGNFPTATAAKLARAKIIQEKELDKVAKILSNLIHSPI